MKRRILHVVYSLEIGGLERVVVTLANRIDPALYESYICCITRAGELSTYLDDPGRLTVIGHTGRVNVSSLWDVYRAVQSNVVDLIHSHNFPGMLYGFPASRLGRIPIVHTQHGRTLREESFLLNTVEKVLSRSVTRYVCVSGRLREEVRSGIGVDEGRLAVIYNGIDVAESDRMRVAAPGGGVIGSVGRLTPIKNYELLVRAFGLIHERFPTWRLELVGGGERYDGIARLAEELSVSGSTVMHGYRLDVERYLGAFDIFVLPSFSEGHSISLLEALSLGKVCIVSRVGGNPEIIEDGVNGFLFDPRSVDELVGKITSVIERFDSPEIGRVRACARETVLSKFSSDTMLAGYDRLYRDILRIGAGGSGVRNE